MLVYIHGISAYIPSFEFVIPAGSKLFHQFNYDLIQAPIKANLVAGWIRENGGRSWYTITDLGKQLYAGFI